MAASESKASFLSWGLSRAPTPRSETDKEKKEEVLKSSGADHLVTHRQPPSLRKYPKGCPPLRTRWFYASDVPKRKPFSDNQAPGEEKKPSVAPKKFVPFSFKDSVEIESAFQRLSERHDAENNQAKGVNRGPGEKVPVNEDYLFDVDIEKRELEPAYWLGPVYEVKRGSWFYPENPPRPCDENLANQLEEGYLKVRPWEFVNAQQARASSQPRSRPSSMILEKPANDVSAATLSNPATPRLAPSDNKSPRLDGTNGYRLFGAYMNSTAIYHDASTVYVTADDFMSRTMGTVYQRFGTVGGTKLVRGYVEPGRTETKATADGTATGSVKRRSVPPDSLNRPSTSSGADRMSRPEQSDEEKTETEQAPKMTTLERQISSLAGEHPEDSAEIEEEARKQEQQEMEDYRELDGDEQDRQIDHLVLVTHGIGQRLGLRLDSLNFIHDVNTLRKSIKAVYANSPDLQALNSQINELPKNSKIQVLPVCWRHLLDFPRQSLRNNRKEADLADLDAAEEDNYPSLGDITVDGVPAVRNLITDLAMDVLLYQSAYREHIAGIVQKECNRVYKLFKERNPSFSGRVSLIGHSLGSAILFDILCRQKATPTGNGFKLKHPSKARSRADTYQRLTLDLDFECENFFCLGSPIALFQMLKGRTIAGRDKRHIAPLDSPFDPDPMDDPFLAAGASRPEEPASKPRNLLPITVSSPKCQDLYNIFHPTDPISYRIEPLISPAMSSLKPQPLPYTKRGLFGAPGIANIGARVGQSVGSMWYNFTSGVASSLLNRSLGLTGEEQALAQDAKTTSQLRSQAQQASLPPGTSSKVGTGEAPTLVADICKQQLLADQTANRHSKTSTSSSSDPSDQAPTHLPTLIDSELETLYSGFQKHRQSSTTTTTADPSHNPHSSSSSPNNNDKNKRKDSAAADDDDDDSTFLTAAASRRLRREEAKVRALNSNGRVDYSIQEGVFDISLLASIASHLSYWADEDCTHFMVGQMLSKKGVGLKGEEGFGDRDRASGNADGAGGDIGVRDF